MAVGEVYTTPRSPEESQPKLGQKQAVAENARFCENFFTLYSWYEEYSKYVVVVVVAQKTLAASLQAGPVVLAAA